MYVMVLSPIPPSNVGAGSARFKNRREYQNASADLESLTLWGWRRGLGRKEKAWMNAG